MISPVFVTNCKLPPISEKEVLRYAGDKNPSEEILALLRDCAEESKDAFADKVAYRILPIRRENNLLTIGSLKLYSKGLTKCLKNCDQVILLAATAGLEIDRLIAKHSRISPARALMLHSIGTERVEALCDAFCKAYEENENVRLTPRFSPGYGDLTLNAQKEILSLLNADRTVGIGLNESLLLSPSKSVTAFAGIERKKERDTNEF